MKLTSSAITKPGSPICLSEVREGFERYDAGELDAFELDELIHRYKKAARELWKFCGDRTHGRSAGFLARTLEEMQGRDEIIDWWDAAIMSVAVAEHEPARGRTQSGHVGGTTGDHSRSSLASSNKLICGEPLSSDDPACPAVPCSPVMKEILGKSMGL